MAGRKRPTAGQGREKFSVRIGAETVNLIEDNNAFLMARGEGSRIEIHAADAAKDSWTQIDTTAEAGSTT